MSALHRDYDSVATGNELVRIFEKSFPRTVHLYDETLRDGEQTPGVSFSLGEKCEIAARLLDAGVRHLTLGFPGSSPEELRVVRELARIVDDKGEAWCVSRMRTEDLQAVHKSGVRNVTIFLPTSDVHLQVKLGLSSDDAVRLIEDHVSIALKLDLKVRFALEDASRTSLSQVDRFALAAVNAGASMLTLADTCGVLTPKSAEGLFSHVRELLPETELVAHCHNDFGLASANSIAASAGGANFVQGALGGLGERAGNAPLEELAVLFALKYGAETGVDLEALCTLATHVLLLTGCVPPANKPLLGSRVFAHESGVHVHGLLQDLSTYEPFPPEIIGRSHEIRFGKHSGISNIQYVVEKHGLSLSEQGCRTVLEVIRQRASTGEELTELVVLGEVQKLVSGA